MDTQRSNTNLLRPSGGDVADINLNATVKDEPESSDDETFKLSGLQERMENVHIVDRFLGRGSVLGKSSGVALIKSALGGIQFLYSSTRYAKGLNRNEGRRLQAAARPSKHASQARSILGLACSAYTRKYLSVECSY